LGRHPCNRLRRTLYRACVEMKKTLIIAEAGVNHDGSAEQAKRLIDVAAESGADVVKFQTFRAENVVTREATKAAYQKETTGADESQLDMLRKLELSASAHMDLADHCRGRGIQFLSTPFDLPSVDFLGRDLGMPTFKIASGEITNAPLMLKVATYRRPMIVSTGMSDLDEIRDALGILAYGLIAPDASPCLDSFRDAFESDDGRAALSAHVSLLHCTTSYPTPFSDVNLRAMDVLAATFGLPVGLSDHSLGTTVPIAAVARGARIVEKHFTLDRALDGPDHQASLEPQELAAMVREIRSVEIVLGDGTKVPGHSELVNREVARRSLVAARRIKEGDVFDEGNLTTKRPGTGISSIFYYDWLGRRAEADYDEGDLIQ
jgi:N-acetylneuraminate synthase